MDRTTQHFGGTWASKGYCLRSRQANLQIHPVRALACDAAVLCRGYICSYRWVQRQLSFRLRNSMRALNSAHEDQLLRCQCNLNSMFDGVLTHMT